MAENDTPTETNETPAGPEPTTPFEGSTALSFDELPKTGENTPPAEEPQEAPAEAEPDKKPDGYNQVDFKTDDRDAIEARFHRLYGQMKRQDQLLNQMTTDNRQLMERLQNFEVGQMQQNIASQMSQLQGQLQEAMDVGDAARTSAIVRQMSQLEARSQVRPQPQQPQQQQAPQQQAPQDGVPADHPDVLAMREWSTSRPWTHEGATHRPWVALQLNDMYNSDVWADRPVHEKLAEVDRRYQELTAPAQQDAGSQQAPVLNQTTSRRRQANGTGKLTDSEKAVALRMFNDLPREEAYTAYAKGKGV